MPIRTLPLLLVNQIAAGEVIERPASVVKELVENSLDAGAARVDVTIEDGGRQLIRVSDDGSGIPAEELPLALAPHATSKLQSAEQLAAIQTMGFRGEALASIASVSRLRLSSRPREGDASQGHVLAVTGDQHEPVAPVGMPVGTVIEVRDLFFNTPGRRKFLRAAGTELGHISDMVERLALAHPQVGFTLRHQERLVRDYPAAPSRRRRCVDVLGKELDEALLETEEAVGPEGYGVWALAGLPAIAKATAKFQYLYVNGRPVRDRGLQHAMKEAYRGLMMPDLQPVVVVFITMPFDAVDVNVHPTKSEVRFREPSRLHGLVLTALRQRLLGTDLTPKAGLSLGMLSGWRAQAEGAADEDAAAATSLPPLETTTQVNPQTFVDYFKRMAPQQQGLVFSRVKEALAQENPSLLSAAEMASPGLSSDAPGGGGGAYGVKPREILQVHQSYVVTQDEDGLLIIDQHALHERVMFEELSQRVLGGKRLESQRLLLPVTLSAPPRRLARVRMMAPLLDRLGIEVEEMGPDTLAVHAFPTFLFDRGVEPAEFMGELLDRADEGEFDELDQPPGNHGNPVPDAVPPGLSKVEGFRAGSVPASATTDAASAHAHGATTAASDLLSEAVLHKALDMMSCKAAVKAGDHLAPEELAALLAKRQEIERSSSCPHGRPTTLRLTLRDLEKQFKRVL